MNLERFLSYFSDFAWIFIRILTINIFSAFSWQVTNATTAYINDWCQFSLWDMTSKWKSKSESDSGLRISLDSKPDWKNYQDGWHRWWWSCRSSLVPLSVITTIMLPSTKIPSTTLDYNNFLIDCDSSRFRSCQTSAVLTLSSFHLTCLNFQRILIEIIPRWWALKRIW